MSDNGFKENYQYVFAQGGLYGASQNDPKRDPAKYADIVRKYYPDDTDERIAERLNLFSTEGCGYVACMHAVFLRYYGAKEEFQRVFGYPMYTPEGKLNFNDLLVDFYCAMDNHNSCQGKDLVSEEEDKPYQGGYGTTERSREWRFELYMKQHGVPVDVKIIRAEPQDIETYLEQGPVLVNIRPNILYDEKGNVVWEKNAGHSMSVVGVAENGLIRVSSWGREYYIKPGTYTEFETYQQVIFLPEVRQESCGQSRWKTCIETVKHKLGL